MVFLSLEDFFSLGIDFASTYFGLLNHQTKSFCTKNLGWRRKKVKDDMKHSVRVIIKKLTSSSSKFRLWLTRWDIILVCGMTFLQDMVAKIVNVTKAKELWAILKIQTTSILGHHVAKMTFRSNTIIFLTWRCLGVWKVNKDFEFFY